MLCSYVAHAISGCIQEQTQSAISFDFVLAIEYSHTAIGVKEDGSPYFLSDTARYRLCGNGVGSVCVQWIAERLADAIQQQTRWEAAA